MRYVLIHARQRLRHLAQNGAVNAVAALLFLTGAGFATAAGWIWLARQWGTLEATGALALGFLVLSGVVLLFRRPAPPMPQPAPPPPPRPEQGSATAILLQAFLLGQSLAAKTQRPPRR